jgi:hypothetical protein
MRAARPIPPLAAGIACAAAIAALASCGGSSNSGSISPQEFQSEANQVCRDSQQQFDRIQRIQPHTADQTEKQAAALADVSRQALDNLHQIEPPAELKANYSRYLAAREMDLGFIEDGRDAAANKDINAYVRATHRAAAQAPLRRQLALQLGLRFCSRPSVTLGK